MPNLPRLPEELELFGQYLQTMPAHALVAALAPGVNVRSLLLCSLADRGLNDQGVWVGFPTAATLLATAAPVLS